jgi:hypothetical protein
MIERVACTSCGASILPSTAEATGGVCMPCKQRGGPPTRSQVVERAYATPARCVSQFAVQTDGEIIAELEQEIESVQVQLACSCGARRFMILGFPMASATYPDQEIFAAPISLQCETCGRREQLFDPRNDGYDGEIDSSAGIVDIGEPSAFLCKKCGKPTFEVAVSLEYSVEDEEMEDWEELAERPQDFFTWFSLYGRCLGCKQFSEITDYECA